MTTDNFGFYMQNRLIPTSQTGGQRHSDTSLFSISWLNHPRENSAVREENKEEEVGGQKY